MKDEVVVELGRVITQNLCSKMHQDSGNSGATTCTVTHENSKGFGMMI